MAETTNERGVLVIVSSPSGAGKTTLARRLLGEFPAVEFSVSYTTRPRRRGEKDGRDYFFVDPQTFEHMVAAGDFAEWAEVHGNRYGTSRRVVETALTEGRDVVFDVDWQGGRQLSAQWRDDALTIFILPPDWTTLEERLRRRATDSDEVIAGRLWTALDELRHHGEYQHVIVNDALDHAYETLRDLYLRRREGADRAETPPGDRGGSAHAAALIEEGSRRQKGPEPLP